MSWIQAEMTSTILSVEGDGVEAFSQSGVELVPNRRKFFSCYMKNRTFLIIRGSLSPLNATARTGMQYTRTGMRCARPEMQCARPGMQRTQPEMQCAQTEMQCARTEMQCAQTEMQCAQTEMQ